MAEVSIRDLRNHGGDVVERAVRGEHLTITRDGKPVAELGPVPRTPVALKTLIDRRQRLPVVDPDRLRKDLDTVIDSQL